MAAKKERKGKSEFDVKVALTEQYQEADFCDAILCVGDGKVRAHRCVLAAATPYFKAMFSGSFQEVNEQEVDLTATFTSLSSLRDIIDYIYGKELIVNEENVAEILRSAEVLMLDDITQLCLHFLLESLTLQNCLWSWSLAELYMMAELIEVCQDLAIQRFHDIMINFQDTLEVPPDFMLKFVEKGITKHCRKEQLEVFFKRYVDHKRNERSSYFQELWIKATEPEDLLEQDLNAESSVGPKNDHAETKVKNSKTPEKETMQDTAGTEEVFIFDTSDKTTLYSTCGNEWFSLIDKDRELRDVKVQCIGIGKDQNYVLMQKQGYYSSDTKMKLYDLSTNRIVTLPEIPKKGYETMADSASRSDLTPFCLNGNLYVAFCSTMSTAEDSVRSNRTYLPRNRNVTLVVYIQKFNLEKFKWKLVDSVIEIKKPSSSFNLHIIFKNDADVYLMLLQQDCINMAKFSTTSENIERLAVGAPGNKSNLLESKVEIYGSTAGNFVRTDKLTMAYDISADMWFCEPHQTEETLDDLLSNKYMSYRHVADSHVHGKKYFLSSQVIKYSITLVSLEANRGKLAELKPPPADLDYAKVYTARVPKTFLQKLSACSVPEDTNTSVCSQREIKRLVKNYRKRKFPQRYEDAKSDGYSDDDFASEYIHVNDGQSFEDDEDYDFEDYDDYSFYPYD